MVRLTEKEFQTLSSFIYKECGINLSTTKKILVESRLQRRLEHLHMDSFSRYCELVMSSGGEMELFHFIDAMTTNKTDFFREPAHFEFLQNEVLPSLQPSLKPFKLWSSACSSGEEPYTIAMVMEEFAVKQHFDYRILATDISTRVLQQASQAIYPERTIKDVPMLMRKKYLLKSKDVTDPRVRIVPALRNRVTFKRLNLIDDYLEVDADFDVVFCRNVLIYFDRATQEKVVAKLISKLKTGGYFFVGHSESVYQMKLPLKQMKPTIFQKT